MADLSSLTVSPCVTRFHCLSHGLTVGSSFLTALQILSGFSLKLKISSENKQGNAIPSQKYRRIVHYIINNYVSFDSETSIRSLLEIAVP